MKLVFVAVALMPLIYVPWLADPAGLARWIFLALLLCIGLITSFFSNSYSPQRWKNPGVLLLFGFVLLAGCSAIWVDDPWVTLTAWSKLWLGLLIFLLVLCHGSNLHHGSFVWKSLLVAAGLLAGIGLLQTHGLSLGINQIAAPAATFMNKNVAAQSAVGLFPGLLWVLWRQDRWSWISLTIMGLLLAFLWQVEARGAWLALGLTTGGLIGFKGIEWRALNFRQIGLKTAWFTIVISLVLPTPFRQNLFADPPLLGMGLLLATVIIGYVLCRLFCSKPWELVFSKGRSMQAPWVPMSLGALCLGLLPAVIWVFCRFNFDTSLEDINPDPHVNTIRVRIALYANSLHILADYPFFGIGWGQFSQIYPLYNHAWVATSSMSAIAIPHHLHQDLLQIAVELGLCGAVLFGAWLGYVLWRGFDTAQPSLQPFPNKTIAFWGISGMLIHSQVSFPMQQPATALLFWTFAGMLVCEPSATHQPSNLWVKCWSWLFLGLVHGVVTIGWIYWGFSSHQLAKASKALAAGDLAQGYTLTQKAHQYFPGDPLPLDQLLTLASRYASNRGEALQIADVFLDRYPNHPNGYFRKAFILKTAGQPQAALQAITRSCELATADSEPWLMKGLIYRDMQQHEMARAAFEEVLKRHPTHGPALEQLRQLDALKNVVSP